MPQFPLLPSGDRLPLAYRWMRAHGLHSITPWHFYDDEEHVAAWRKRYRDETGKDAWPFAYRQDRMEVAVFRLRSGIASGKILILDTDRFDTAGGGTPYSVVAKYAKFMDWFTTALQETQEWMTEAELAAILEE
jgi:hypothetical protein